MPEVTLSFGAAMGCRHCVREVTRWLRDVPGVETIAADAGNGTIVVGGTMTVADVLAAFAGSDYGPRVTGVSPAAP
ncbi:MAG TPA: cation transporter [Frankiaceae bacterium]|nr:cation transporter [Frankiaceae bacterium]